MADGADVDLKILIELSELLEFFFLLLLLYFFANAELTFPPFVSEEAAVGRGLGELRGLISGCPGLIAFNPAPPALSLNISNARVPLHHHHHHSPHKWVH